MDRKTFLRTSLEAAGALAVAPSGISALADFETNLDQLPAAPRPTLRLAGGDFGFPSPFAYVANPGYWRMSLLYDTLLWDGTAGA